ncbi:uncharacterized protein TrAtP1_002803 [Trichoderma atroviride]|uniref:uncharacterized protein n=1 Tax=Hypocrea atroviridis TaxID=63577 RepID=UPI00331BEFBD|nr:hypothetical protein TrAtP1_002803 [Trichoderma atroviride]
MAISCYSVILASSPLLTTEPTALTKDTKALTLFNAWKYLLKDIKVRTLYYPVTDVDQVEELESTPHKATPKWIQVPKVQIAIANMATARQKPPASISLPNGQLNTAPAPTASLFSMSPELKQRLRASYRDN